MAHKHDMHEYDTEQGSIDAHEYDHHEAHEHNHEHDRHGAHGHSHEHDRHGAHGHSHEHGGHEHNDVCEHGHAHAHGHHHDPKEKKRQLARLARVIGHLQYVKKMIEDDEDCALVLQQISASKSALNGLGKQIINEHITHCITHAIEEGDTEAVEEFQKAIQKYL